MSEEHRRKIDEIVLKMSEDIGHIRGVTETNQSMMVEFQSASRERYGRVMRLSEKNERAIEDLIESRARGRGIMAALTAVVGFFGGERLLTYFNS